MEEGTVLQPPGKENADGLATHDFLFRHGAHQAERCPGAAEVGDWHQEIRRRDARMTATGHWPGAILLLPGYQERHGSPHLLPVVFHSGQVKHVERLPGGVSVTGSALELAPAAVLVLPAQEPLNLR